MRDKNLTDDVIDEIIAAPKTSLEQLLALELKHERKQTGFPLTVVLPTTRLWAGVIDCYAKDEVIAAIEAAGGAVIDGLRT